MVRVALKCPEICKLCDTIFRLPPTSSPEKSWYLATFVLKLFFFHIALAGELIVWTKNWIYRKNTWFSTPKILSNQICQKNRHFLGTLCPRPAFQNPIWCFHEYTPTHACVERFWHRSGTIVTQRTQSWQDPRVHNGGSVQTLKIHAWPYPSHIAIEEDKYCEFLENAQKWWKYGFYTVHTCATRFFTSPHLHPGQKVVVWEFHTSNFFLLFSLAGSPILSSEWPKDAKKLDVF